MYNEVGRYCLQAGGVTCTSLSCRLPLIMVLCMCCLWLHLSPFYVACKLVSQTQEAHKATENKFKAGLSAT